MCFGLMYYTHDLKIAHTFDAVHSFSIRCVMIIYEPYFMDAKTLL